MATFILQFRMAESKPKKYRAGNVFLDAAAAAAEVAEAGHEPASGGGRRPIRVPRKSNTGGAEPGSAGRVLRRSSHLAADLRAGYFARGPDRIGLAASDLWRRIASCAVM